jgi:Spy/CpxP family protein refolding chaperone
MKIRRMIYLMAIIVMATMSTTYGQRGMRGNPGQCLLPDLTPEQKTKIEALRTPHLAASNAHRAQMGELRAKKRTLTLAEKPDMREINSVIDQMEKLRSNQMKAAVAHRQAVRETLTPEQRAVYDSRPIGRGQGRGQGRSNMQGNPPRGRGNR